VLAFSADPRRRERLIRFASWLEGGSGLTAAIRVLEGEGALMRRERELAEEELQSQIDELGLDVYPRVVLAADSMEGVPVVVQSFGIGALQANTALFGWPERPDEERRVPYVRSLLDISRLGINVVAMWSDEQRWGSMTARSKRNRRIDVWWNDDDSSRLALLTAYLFTRNSDWSRASIRLLASAGPEGIVQRRADLTAMLEEARIQADVVCLVNPDQAAVVNACADATLVLVTMRIRRDETLDALGGDLDLLLRQLPMTAAVMAGESFDLLAGPESGHHESLAEAEEALQEAQARLATLERKLAEASAALDDARTSGVSDSADHVAELERRREIVMRRTIKARVRVESAQAEVDALSGF
jgi:hypothetical protein